MAEARLCRLCSPGTTSAQRTHLNKVLLLVEKSAPIVAWKSNLTCLPVWKLWQANLLYQTWPTCCTRPTCGTRPDTVYDNIQSISISKSRPNSRNRNVDVLCLYVWLVREAHPHKSSQSVQSLLLAGHYLNDRNSSPVLQRIFIPEYPVPDKRNLEAYFYGFPFT